MTAAAADHASLERRLLGAWVRVTLSDGRAVVGTLDAVDSDRNVVLSSAAQTNAGPGGGARIQLGYAMVPGSAIVRVEVGETLPES